MATLMAELIARGDAEALRAALRAEPGRLDERDERERTPLHLAAAAGRADLVEVLLSCGADPGAG